MTQIIIAVGKTIQKGPNAGMRVIKWKGERDIYTPVTRK